MMRSLWISKTGMEAQQIQLDTISNNLANVSTNGYKRSHAVFEDLMYQNMRQAGAASSEQTELPTGLQVGLGTRAVATARNFSQGNLQQSSNPLDVAIRGNGFFQIQLPDGTTGYTRDGSFQVSATGQLVTNNGYTVQPGITIPAAAQSVTISAAADELSMNQRPACVGISALSSTPSTVQRRPIFWMLPSAFSSIVVRPPAMLPLVGCESERSDVLWRLTTSW